MADILIPVVCGALLTACVSLGLLLVRTRSQRRRIQADLARFQNITDLEQHASEQIARVAEANAKLSTAQQNLEQLDASIATARTAASAQEAELAEKQRAIATAAQMLGEYRTLAELKQQADKQKERANRYNQLLGNFKTADEFRLHIEKQKQRIGEFERIIGRFETLQDLNRQVALRKAEIGALDTRVKELGEVIGGANNAFALHEHIKNQEAALARLKAEIQQVEEAREMQEFGFYRPRYDFDSSSKYQIELDRVRQCQADMVKNDTAVIWQTTWSVEGSAAQGRKMMKEQAKLMLRAFNGECDAAVARVKYNNATSLEARIQRSFDQINKLGKTKSASINDRFLHLKLDELHLVHEHRVRQQQEKEEQRRIREQMREEEKARREIEEAQEKAARDEELVEQALERARRNLEAATQDQRAATEEAREQAAKLAQQVAKLESELKSAIDRKAKAIARAQLTRSGYIYVLSNIGSFGDHVYKLGMTRRLDPLERVKELGDASVPFPFDVHAVIYSENAPDLEAKLHRHFASRRLNMVNLRREYFRVSLEEVIDAVRMYFGEITFVKTAEAAEYRETVAKIKAEGITTALPMGV